MGVKNLWIVNKKRNQVYNTDHIVSISVSEQFAEINARIVVGTGDATKVTLGSYKTGATAKRVFNSLMESLDMEKDFIPNLFDMPRDEEVK